MIYTCVGCQKTFPKKSNIMYHVNKIHPCNSENKKIIQKETNGLIELYDNNFIRIKNNELKHKFECNCGKIFKTKYNFNRHFNNCIHGNKPKINLDKELYPNVDLKYEVMFLDDYNDPYVADIMNAYDFLKLYNENPSNIFISLYEKIFFSPKHPRNHTIIYDKGLLSVYSDTTKKFEKISPVHFEYKIVNTISLFIEEQIGCLKDILPQDDISKIKKNIDYLYNKYVNSETIPDDEDNNDENENHDDDKNLVEHRSIFLNEIYKVSEKNNMLSKKCRLKLKKFLMTCPKHNVVTK